MSANAAEIRSEQREDVSVYWRPGCSSCLKVKEFVEEQGIAFESVNVAANTKAMEEIFAAGLRSIPAVRRGDRFVYAQSLEDVASLLGVSRDHKRLSNSDLFARWEPILKRARRIVEKFSDADLNSRVIPIRERTLKELAIHIFQITVAFRKQMDEGVLEIKPICAYVDPSIVTKADLLTYIDKMTAALHDWLASDKPNAITARIPTYYGEQDSGQVIERAVWHCMQHARQLDIISAGRFGAEFEMPQELYAGLPLPKRLWV
jgi:glutaredoxin